MKELIGMFQIAAPSFPRFLFALVVIALVVVPGAYFYSVQELEQQMASASPQPPAEEPLNQVLMRRQLENAKKRNQRAAPTVEVQSAHVGSNGLKPLTNEERQEVQRIAAERVKRLEAEGILPLDESTPKTDVFGRPLDAPDPCEGYRDPPDFTSGDWPSFCVDHGVPHEHCQEWLKTEWGLGNQELHDAFELPPGCLP